MKDGKRKDTARKSDTTKGKMDCKHSDKRHNSGQVKEERSEMIQSGTGMNTQGQHTDTQDISSRYTGLSLKDLKGLDVHTVTTRHAREAIEVLSAQCGIPRIREPYRHVLRVFMDKVEDCVCFACGEIKEPSTGRYGCPVCHGEGLE